MAKSPIESPAPSLVIFDSRSAPALLTDKPVLTSWRDGPQKLTGFVKRGRPRKEKKKAVVNNNLDEQTCNELKFGFVNYAGSPKKPNAQVQKAIRSHAMLDFRRQERKSKFKSKQLQAVSVNSTNDTMASSTIFAALFPVEISAADPFDAFPVKINCQMLANLRCYATAVYDILYPIEKYAGYNPVKEQWLPMAFAEPALFYSIMFCAERISTTARGLKESPIAIEHLRNSINCVNEKLLAPVPEVTDATIVVVCSLAHTEKLHGNIDNWKVHMNGLKQMVRIRGGLDAFELNRQVRSKICRADLCGSIDECDKPYFDFSRHIEPRTSVKFVGISSYYAVDSQLLQILSQIQTANANLIAIQQKQTTIHPLTVREEITATQYALISYSSPRNDLRDYAVHEVLRLGLLLYLVTLVNEALPGTSISETLCVRLALRLEEVKLDDSLTDDLKLWLTFVGASIAKNVKSKAYFIRSAIDIRDKLAVNTWMDAVSIFRSFLWVENVHEVTFKVIWKELQLGIDHLLPI